MYDTYIFDLDGTLLDTLDDLTAATNYALRSCGMPVHSRDDVRRFVGNGVRRLMERAVPGGASHPQFEQALDTFRQYYLEHSLDSTRPYDGIPELLTTLRQQGRHVAVVSNKFCTATQELCQHFFADTVEVAIGENEAAGIRKKPAPDTVMEALRQLGCGLQIRNNDQVQIRNNDQVQIRNNGGRAVYIGDSDVDLLTARNAGLPCISVLWGFRDRDFLLAHGATTLAACPADILAL